jgi:ABC-type lipoprotein export system ATPase subunit
MLTIDHLSKSYTTSRGTITPLRDFALTVGAGEFVAIHGPSGCGKTTLLLIAGGLLQPDRGSVQVAGRDLYRLSADERARFRSAQIGFVFQQFHLIPYLTVLDNVLTAALAVPVVDSRKKALQLLTRFGLSDRWDHVPAALSTGERQRTTLARALLHGPKLLLADEPTGNLDEENGQIVLGHLAEFARDGSAVLLVTHDRQAAVCASRSVALGGCGETAS